MSVKRASRHSRLKTAGEYAVILFGTLLYAAAVIIFIQPVQIPLGGVTGIALVLHSLLSFPVGVTTLVLNIPLFLIGGRQLGRKFLLRTLTATFAVSVALDLGAPFLPAYEGNELLAALYGGVLMGIGLGLVFSRSGTMGGSDILARLINVKWSHISLGNINLVINMTVILAASLIYQSTDAALFAIIVQYISAAALDTILSGLDNANSALIVTEKPADLSSALMQRLRRGVTNLPGTGMYTGKERHTLLCVVRSHEITELKRILREQDPDAFVIISPTREVLGHGFKSYGS